MEVNGVGYNVVWTPKFFKKKKNVKMLLCPSEGSKRSYRFGTP